MATDLVELSGHARDHGGTPDRLGNLETGIELGDHVLGDGRRHVLLAHGDLLFGPHAADLVLCRHEDVQVDLGDTLARVQRLQGESQCAPAVAGKDRVQVTVHQRCASGRGLVGLPFRGLHGFDPRAVAASPWRSSEAG